MKRALLVVSVLGAALLAWRCSASDLPVATLSIEGEQGSKATLMVELAVTPAEHQRGLMHREELAEHAGMLFTYNPPQQAGFWMKNTLIPLDMVFIGPDWRVSRIAPMAQPHSEKIISSQGPVAAVLEINGGLAEKWNIQPGDKVIVAP